MPIRRRAVAYAAAAVTLLVLSFAVVATTTARPAQAAVANGTSIVHLFQWRWSSIASECETNLGPHGWGGVQVSPPQEHVVLPSAEGSTYPWWQDYQPVSYRLDQTRRGTRAEFVDMVQRCRAAGVKIYVDVVLNHMTGTGWSGNGSAGTPYSKYNYPNLFNDGSGDAYVYADFGNCYTPISNWNSKAEVQDCELLNLADLNTGNAEVRRKIAKYMNSVIDLGVAGFRVDAAKHVQEADLSDIISRLHNVPEFGGRPDIFHEVYGDSTIPYTAYAPLGKVTNFDYQRAVSSGFQGGNIAQFANMPNYGGLTGGQAVVFVDNHDTQRATPTLTYKNGDRYYLADSFMMAHPYGTVQLMSSYAFGSVQGQGPPSSGNGTTNATSCGTQWICEHRNEQVAGMPSFRNATEGTGISNQVTDGNGRLGFARGTRGYAAFNATDSAWTRTFTTSLPDGTYCNVARGTFVNGTCTGGVITVSGGSFTTTIPANRGVAIHVNARTTGTPPAQNVAVSFHATVTTWFGQNVFVVGSTAQLGSWNPANAIALSSADYPVWKGTVSLPTGQPVEYKFIKKDPNGTVTWEAGANRTHTPTAPVTLTGTWR